MFEQWPELIAVVEQASLNRAARILNISQPALSRKIMKLEDELGVSIFERKGKRLVLTRVGQMCYDYALEFRALQRQFQESLSRHKATANSSLIIGASLTTLQSTLPDLIALYTQDYPETDIKAITGKTHEIVTLVKEKKVDLGLIASSIEEKGLTCVPLFDDHLCLVLPSTHSLFDRKLDVRSLNDLPMILFSKGTWYRILMDELFHRYSVFPDVKMEIDSFEAIIRLVSTTQVATLLPKSYLRSQVLADNGLGVRNIEELAQTTRTTSLVFTSPSDINAAARHMIDKAKSFFSHSD